MSFLHQVGIILLSCLCLSACRQARGPDYAPAYGDRSRIASGQATYTFAVFPLHNALHLYSVYQPMIDMINRQVTGLTLRLEVGRDYASYESQLQARHYDVALLNPYQSLVSESLGYRIFGKMGDD